MSVEKAEDIPTCLFKSWCIDQIFCKHHGHFLLKVKYISFCQKGSPNHTSEDYFPVGDLSSPQQLLVVLFFLCPDSIWCLGSIWSMPCYLTSHSEKTLTCLEKRPQEILCFRTWPQRAVTIGFWSAGSEWWIKVRTLLCSSAHLFICWIVSSGVVQGNFWV